MAQIVQLWRIPVKARMDLAAGICRNPTEKEADRWTEMHPTFTIANPLMIPNAIPQGSFGLPHMIFRNQNWVFLNLENLYCWLT